MINIILTNIIRFFVLVLIQIFILNNILLGGFINPYLYILFVLLLPFDIPKWLLLISAFLMGICIDTFSSTGGLHTASLVFMAFCRPLVIKLVFSKQDNIQEFEPNIASIGFQTFLLYALLLTLIHHFTLFYLEIFRFSEFFFTFFRSLFSSVFTIILIFISQLVFGKIK